MTSVDPTPASGMEAKDKHDALNRIRLFLDKNAVEYPGGDFGVRRDVGLISATLRSAETSAAVGGVDGWRCDNCGCRTYARVDILVEGKFQPGPDVRCVECKDVSAYFETDWQRELGPEECADADMSYWGEE